MRDNELIFQVFKIAAGTLNTGNSWTKAIQSWESWQMAHNGVVTTVWGGMDKSNAFKIDLGN